MTDTVRSFIEAELAKLVQLSSLPSELGYGTDLVCVTDIDQRLTETSPTSIASLSQDLFHRITTARGSLQDDPNYGIDVRARLSAAQTPQAMLNLQHEIEAECRKDDRVLGIEALVSFVSARSELRVSLQVSPVGLTTSDSFTLVLLVTSAEAIIEAENG